MYLAPESSARALGGYSHHHGGGGRGGNLKKANTHTSPAVRRQIATGHPAAPMAALPLSSHFGPHLHLARHTNNWALHFARHFPKAVGHPTTAHLPPHGHEAVISG